MGKRLPSAVKIEAHTRLVSERIKASSSKFSKPQPPKTLAPSPEQIQPQQQLQGRHRQHPQPQSPTLAAAMDEGRSRDGRIPLSEVVADCVKRWFQDTLKEARNGDQAMQVLVGQMYQSGYGVAKNEQKAKAWISKASKYRPSAWKVSEKRPGYVASDSDTDEAEDNKNDGSL